MFDQSLDRASVKQIARIVDRPLQPGGRLEQVQRQIEMRCDPFGLHSAQLKSGQRQPLLRHILQRKDHLKQRLTRQIPGWIKLFNQLLKGQVLMRISPKRCLFEKLVEELKPVRDLSRQPLFQVAFALQNFPEEKLTLPRLELSRMGDERMTAKFDLSLYVSESASGLQGMFEYATDLFDQGSVERLVGHFKTLLSGIVTTPESRISELPFLSEEERHRILVEWNDTRRDYGQDKCIQELFEEQVVRTPEAVALVYEEQQVSYGELNAQANQLAHYLRELRVGPDERVRRGIRWTGSRSSDSGAWSQGKVLGKSTGR